MKKTAMAIVLLVIISCTSSSKKETQRLSNLVDKSDTSRVFGSYIDFKDTTFDIKMGILFEITKGVITFDSLFNSTDSTAKLKTLQDSIYFYRHGADSSWTLTVKEAVCINRNVDTCINILKRWKDNNYAILKRIKDKLLIKK